MCDKQSAFERSIGDLPFLKFPFIFPFFLAATFSFLPFLLSVFTRLYSIYLFWQVFPYSVQFLAVSYFSLFLPPPVYFLLSLSFSSIFSCSVHTCIILFLTLSYRFVSFFSTFLFPDVQSKCCSEYRNAWLSHIVLCLQKMVVFWWQDSKFLAASSK